LTIVREKPREERVSLGGNGEKRKKDFRKNQVDLERKWRGRREKREQARRNNRRKKKAERERGKGGWYVPGPPRGRTMDRA